MKFHLYRDRKREWRWHLKSRNGRITATSGEGYKRRKDCRACVLKVMGTSEFTEIRYELGEGK